LINLYDRKETNFNHNGLVVLHECTSCNIQEELNGMFELELEYPILNNIRKVGFIDPTQIVDETKIHEKPAKWTYLLEGNIIKADEQLFRIYRKIKNINSIKVNARHISYDLLDNLIGEIDIRGLSCISALTKTMNSTAYPHSFTHMSDISTINNISLEDESGDIIDKNPTETIFKLINLYSAELVRDNYNIKLLGKRGSDRGVLITYGKNIEGIEESLDLDGVCTRIKAIDQDGWTLPEIYIDSPYINNFANPKIKVITFNDIADESDLRTQTQQYFTKSKCDIPQFNYKIDFLELSKTDEYKKYAVLERVYLGDTVTIKHKKLNINLKAKVIKITKNPLTNRIEKIELGSFKPNMATAIDNSIQGVKDDIVKVTSDYQKAIDNATALITGSKGGNVVIRQNDDKKPYEILIMDTTDVMTAEKVWRWNLGGFGYSHTGINGPYETAITMDGHIVASFITALEIHGEQITAGLIKSKTGKWQINLDTESFNLGNKLVFNGDSLVFGSAVTLSWAQVTGTPTVLSANDIKSTVITKDYIGSLNLIVGNEIQMGSNARISWGNVDSKPTLVTDYDQLSSKPYIPPQYYDSQAVQAWVNSGYKTFIDSSGVYTGTVIAERIMGGMISGCTLRTVSSGQKGIILEQQYLDAVDTSGISRLRLGWDITTPFIRLGADDGYDFKLSHSGGITTFKGSTNGTNFVGPLNFSGATVTGLNSTVIAKFG
jgi:phage minor structural protein